MDIDQNQLNETVHRALASRAQTFDVEMWELINKQVKEGFSPPLVKIKDRIHRFKISGENILALTQTSYYISNNDFESLDHGKEIGVVKTVRSMNFKIPDGEYSDELFYLEKN